MEVIKIDENTIKVIRQETQTKEATYSYGDLIKQKETIEKQKVDEMARRDAEIAEVDVLIAECVKLGVGIV